MREEGGGLETCGVLFLTRHFEDQLRKRLGIDLTIEMVNRLLGESKRIRRQRTVYRLINGSYKPVVELAEFWHHEGGCIMIIDEWASRAVTIVTPNDRLPPIRGHASPRPMGRKTQIKPNAETRRKIRKDRERRNRCR